MRISGTDIYIAQGDSGSLTLTFEEAQTGLNIFIGVLVRNDKDDGDVFYENDNLNSKEPNSETGLYEYTFEIPSSVTQKAGKYYYDVYISIENEEGSKQTTIINKSLFVVEESARKSIKNTVVATDGENK